VIQLYQQANVVVLPALSESHFGIPNVLLEAMAVETPVVCTPLPSLAEVVQDGKHGLYVPERNPQALADTLAGLARDPQCCRAMGVAGRQTIEELFDAEKNASILAALFGTEHRGSCSGAEAASAAFGPSAQVFSMTSHALADPLSGDG
jgi:glycosyltransferase involved in cell wall biosynthesis